jgi:hypothetical protein
VTPALCVDSEAATTKIAYWDDCRAPDAEVRWTPQVSALAAVLSSVFASPVFSVEDYKDVEEGWTCKSITVHYSESENERDEAERLFYEKVEGSADLIHALSSVVVSFSSSRAA